MVELFANSGDPDQMPHSAASDLGLHCLPITFIGVSRLQWVKQVIKQTVPIGAYKIDQLPYASVLEFLVQYTYRQYLFIIRPSLYAVLVHHSTKSSKGSTFRGKILTD